jgi:hypothetical protein
MYNARYLCPISIKIEIFGGGGSLYQRFSLCCMWEDARAVMAKLAVKFRGINGERRLLASSCQSVRACLCPHVSPCLSVTDFLGICNLSFMVKIEQHYLSGTFILLAARRSNNAKGTHCCISVTKPSSWYSWQLRVGQQYKGNYCCVPWQQWLRERTRVSRYAYCTLRILLTYLLTQTVYLSVMRNTKSHNRPKGQPPEPLLKLRKQPY